MTRQERDPVAEKDSKAAQGLYTSVLTELGLPADAVPGLEQRAYQQFARIISGYRTADPRGSSETRANVKKDATAWFLREYTTGLIEEADVLKSMRYGLKGREEELKLAHARIRDAERTLSDREQALAGREVRYEEEMRQLGSHVKINTEASTRLRERETTLEGERALIEEERTRIEQEKENLRRAKEAFDGDSKALETRKVDAERSAQELEQRWTQYRALEDALKQRDDSLREREIAYKEKDEQRRLGTAALAAELDKVKKREQELEEQGRALEKERARLVKVDSDNAATYKTREEELSLREARIVDEGAELRNRRQIIEAAQKNAEEKAAAAERMRAEAEHMLKSAQAAPSDRDSLLKDVNELRRRAEAAESDATTKQGMLDEVGRSIGGLKSDLDRARTEAEEARTAGELTDGRVIAYLEKRAQPLRPGSPIPVGQFFRGKTRLPGGKGGSDSITYILPAPDTEKPVEVTATPVEGTAEKKE